MLTSIRWVNETGAVLDSESKEHHADVQGDCSTFLNVTRQTLHSTSYTCQLLDELDNVIIEVVYNPDTGDHPGFLMGLQFSEENYTHRQESIRLL